MVAHLAPMHVWKITHKLPELPPGFPLQQCCSVLATSWPIWGPSVSHLETMVAPSIWLQGWALPTPSATVMHTLLDLVCSVLALSWHILGPSVSPLGAMVAPLAPSWPHLGTSWGPVCRILGPWWLHWLPLGPILAHLGSPKRKQNRSSILVVGRPSILELHY